MQLFDSWKTYAWAFCVYFLVALEKSYELAKDPSFAPSPSADGKGVLLALITVCVAAYLIGLLRKTSNRLEQAVILLTEALCVLELAHLVAGLGIAWAEIPGGHCVIAIVHLAATGLVGVRTFEVLRHRSPTQETG